METIKVQKNQIIAKQKEKVKAWYLILEGSVVQRNSYARIVLNKESVIGVSEKDRFLCDYIAREDSVLAVFPYNKWAGEYERHASSCCIKAAADAA